MLHIDHSSKTVKPHAKHILYLIFQTKKPSFFAVALLSVQLRLNKQF